MTEALQALHLDLEDLKEKLRRKSNSFHKPPPHPPPPSQIQFWVRYFCVTFVGAAGTIVIAMEYRLKLAASDVDHTPLLLFPLQG